MKALVSIVTLSLIFGGFASVFAPALLEWYAKPSVAYAADCSGAIDWALQKFVMIQAACAFTGAVLGLIAYLWLRSGRVVQQPPAQVSK